MRLCQIFDGFWMVPAAFLEHTGHRIGAFEKGLKVLVYCSDIAGAFDRVSKERLLAKLRAKGLLANDGWRLASVH